MEEIITSNDDLLKLVKGGHFFTFCCAFACNNGLKDAIKEKKEVKFTVGDYNVTLDHKHGCFIFHHKTFFARIITAYYQEVVFVGDNEDEVISELLAEVEKELNKTILL